MSLINELNPRPPDKLQHGAYSTVKNAVYLYYNSESLSFCLYVCMYVCMYVCLSETSRSHRRRNVAQ